jgi:hypothetical protein
MRSPTEMDIIQVDISTKCHLKCSNCTRLIAHQPKREDMPLEKFEQAVKSMEGWQRPGNILGVIAGEPTLHSEFEQISMRFAELWGGPLTGNGKFPVADFNDMAVARLHDRTNGRGLWTSLGAGFYRHYETIMEVYGFWNVNTHETAGRHQALLLSRKDYQEATGISDDQWIQNRDNCWVQKLWSATINDKGAYFCEVAATIDRLYFGGAHAWPVEQGWWQRQPDDFKSQLDLCNYCSLAQPGPAQIDMLERDIISEENVAKLIQAGSPAVKKRNYEKFDRKLHLERRNPNTKTNYIEDPRRVGIGHRSTKPHKLSGVVVSVNYARHLAETLPQNIAQFDQFAVVTTAGDLATQAVAKENGATLVISNRCYDDDHSFNKGRMLNDGLAALDNPDWVIVTDADVFLNKGTRDYVLNHSLNPGSLHFTKRQDRGGAASPFGQANIAPCGYFQLFSARAKSLRSNWPKVMGEEFCSAGGVDDLFWQQWEFHKIVFIPELEVEHLPGGGFAENWNGLQDNNTAGKWRQLGFLTKKHGLILLNEMKALPATLKLTDTRYGQSAIIATNEFDSYVRVKEASLEFLGKDLGICHIHVAYRDTPSPAAQAA